MISHTLFSAALETGDVPDHGYSNSLGSGVRTGRAKHPGKTKCG